MSGVVQKEGDMRILVRFFGMSKLGGSILNCVDLDFAVKYLFKSSTQ